MLIENIDKHWVSDASLSFFCEQWIVKSSLGSKMFHKMHVYICQVQNYRTWCPTPPSLPPPKNMGKQSVAGKMG